MSVEKLNGKWYIRGKIKLDDGGYYEYRQIARGCRGKKEAQEYERIFRKKYQDIQVSKNFKTFREISTEYLNSLTSQKRSTLRSYEDRLDYINSVFGDKHINLINKDMLQKFIKDLENKYSEEYVSKFYYIIRNVFEYAIINDQIAVNPMRKVMRRVDKSTVKKEMNFWEPAEFERFLSVIDDAEHRAFFIFLYWMGVRKGEAYTLQWKDIDFDTDTVKIYKTITNKTKGISWEITTPKTNNSNRNITMFKVVHDSLLQWKKECMQKFGFSEECFVFGFSRPLADNTAGRWKDHYINMVNANESNSENFIPLRRIRIHDFRHSHASYLINNMGKYNFSDFDIAKRLGHTVDMLHKTYAHQFKGKDKEIINSIENHSSSALKTNDNVKIVPYAEELKMLKELYDAGILTESEFTAKKQQILGI